MPKTKRPIEGIIVEFFQTVDLAKMKGIFDLVQDIVKRRLKAPTPIVRPYEKQKEN